jgi:hypothetical protein
VTDRKYRGAMTFPPKVLCSLSVANALAQLKAGAPSATITHRCQLYGVVVFQRL